MPDSSFASLLNYLFVGAGVFALGMVGFLARRNLILMFLSAEMMLQGVALSLVGFARFHGQWTGQVLTIMVLTVAACEAGVALALVLVVFARKQSLDVSLWKELREEDAPAVEDDPQSAEPIEVLPGPESYPRLTPAGLEPPHPDAALEQRRV